MTRRVLRSLGYGLVLWVVLTALSVLLPPKVFPVSRPGGWHNILFYMGLGVQNALGWPELFWGRVFPRAPGDVINFNCIVAVELTNILLLFLLVFVSFTIAEHRRRYVSSKV